MTRYDVIYQRDGTLYYYDTLLDCAVNAVAGDESPAELQKSFTPDLLDCITLTTAAVL